MNPFLASAIILILRWLQFIAANQVLTNQPIMQRELMLTALLEDSKRFSDRLSDHTLKSNGMSDAVIDGKVQ